jgi:serine/threonine protein kinase
MAPEIFKKVAYSTKVDIWALGVLIFKMLFGDFPFKGKK